MIFGSNFLVLWRPAFVEFSVEIVSLAQTVAVESFHTKVDSLRSKINIVATELWNEILSVNPAFEEYSKVAEVCFFRSEDSSDGVFQVIVLLMIIINVDV